MAFQKSSIKTLITTTEEGLVVDSSEKEIVLFYKVVSVTFNGEACEIKLHFSAHEDEGYRYYNTYTVAQKQPMDLTQAEEEILKLSEFSQ